MEQSRPLDTLNAARNKQVIVELKNGRQYIGNLKAFDIHINVVLDDAEERENGETKRKLGTVFLRGDTIIVISPAWKEHQVLEGEVARKAILCVVDAAVDPTIADIKNVLRVGLVNLQS